MISVLILAYYRAYVGKTYENSTAKLWREKGLCGTESCLWLKINHGCCFSYWGICFTELEYSRVLRRLLKSAISNRCCLHLSLKCNWTHSQLSFLSIRCPFLLLSFSTWFPYNVAQGVGPQRLETGTAEDRSSLHSLKLSVSVRVTPLALVAGIGIGTAVYWPRPGDRFRWKVALSFSKLVFSHILFSSVVNRMVSINAGVSGEGDAMTLGGQQEKNGDIFLSTLSSFLTLRNSLVHVYSFSCENEIIFCFICT